MVRVSTTTTRYTINVNHLLTSTIHSAYCLQPVSYRSVYLLISLPRIHNSSKVLCTNDVLLGTSRIISSLMTLTNIHTFISVLLLTVQIMQHAVNINRKVVSRQSLSCTTVSSSRLPTIPCTNQEDLTILILLSSSSVIQHSTMPLLAQSVSPRDINQTLSRAQSSLFSVFGR